MKRPSLLIITLVLLAFPASVALSQPLKVGTLLDHSGALKEWGPHHRNSVELAVRQMAEAGFAIRLVHADSGTDAAVARKAARKLIDKARVAAIIGSSSSGVIVPLAADVILPGQMLMISPGATSPFISVLPADADKDLLYRTCPSDALQGVVLGKLAASLYKTASVMYVNNPYGQGLANQFRKSFQARGGWVYTMLPHDEAVAASYHADLRKAYARMYLTKPFRSGQSDVLAVFSYPEHAKVYVKEAIEAFGARHFLFCDGSRSEALAQAVGPDNLEGMLGTNPGVAVGEAFARFSADYKLAFKDLPRVPFIANAYDAAAVIGLAAYAARAKNLPLTSANIRDHLRQIANPPGQFVGPGEFAKAFGLLKSGAAINYQGASGAIDFDRNGDVVAPIEIWKFTGGRIVTYSMEYQIPEE